MAGTLRGGLHLGLSGFAFWSYDVPGFHGVPNFMNSRPAGDVYVRWTQMAAFTSHMRYHGAQPREPYEYPEIAPIVRQWVEAARALDPRPGRLGPEGDPDWAAGVACWFSMMRTICCVEHRRRVDCGQNRSSRR